MKTWRNEVFIKWVVIVISLSILTGCNKQGDQSDSVGAGPTIEEMSKSNSNKDKDQVIEDAIKMSEAVMLRLNNLDGISASMVFINHEAVLVALKLDEGIELSEEIRDNIDKSVYEIYPEAKNIAISDDEYIYESIAKLLRSYKENDPFGELLKDLQEILNQL